MADIDFTGTAPLTGGESEWRSLPAPHDRVRVKIWRSGIVDHCCYEAAGAPAELVAAGVARAEWVPAGQRGVRKPAEADGSQWHWASRGPRSRRWVISWRFGSPGAALHMPGAREALATLDAPRAHPGRGPGLRLVVDNTKPGGVPTDDLAQHQHREAVATEPVKAGDQAAVQLRCALALARINVLRAISPMELVAYQAEAGSKMQHNAKTALCALELALNAIGDVRMPD